jgi:hypothetical protein
VSKRIHKIPYIKITVITFNISEDIWIFRMIHYKNLSHILKNGLCTKDSIKADPNYIPIGDALLIEKSMISL